MAERDIEPLNRSYDRQSFDCGNEVLNEWLQKRAGQWGKKELARTYVAVERGQSQVFGYYAIASHHVSYRALSKELAKGLPQIDVPVVLLGRLAVDKRAQGKGLGNYCWSMRYAVQRISLRTLGSPPWRSPRSMMRRGSFTFTSDSRPCSMI